MLNDDGADLQPAFGQSNIPYLENVRNPAIPQLSYLGSVVDSPPTPQSIRSID